MANLNSLNLAVQMMKDIVNADPTKPGSMTVFREINRVASNVAAFGGASYAEVDLSVALGDSPSGDEIQVIGD